MDPQSTPLAQKNSLIWFKFLLALIIILLLVISNYLSFSFGKRSSTETITIQPTPTQILPTATSTPFPEIIAEVNSECAFHSPLYYEIAVKDTISDESNKKINVYCGDISQLNKKIIDIAFDKLWNGKLAQGGPAVSLIRVENNFSMGKTYAGGGYQAWFGIRKDGVWNIQTIDTDICKYLQQNGFPFSFTSFYQC